MRHSLSFTESWFPLQSHMMTTKINYRFMLTMVPWSINMLLFYLKITASNSCWWKTASDIKGLFIFALQVTSDSSNTNLERSSSVPHVAECTQHMCGLCRQNGSDSTRAGYFKGFTRSCFFFRQERVVWGNAVRGAFIIVLDINS